jgi:hypothetical protein
MHSRLSAGWAQNVPGQHPEAFAFDGNFRCRVADGCEPAFGVALIDSPPVAEIARCGGTVCGEVTLGNLLLCRTARVIGRGSSHQRGCRRVMLFACRVRAA